MLLASSCSNPFTSKSDSNNQSDKTDVTIEFPAELFRSISAGRGVEEEADADIIGNNNSLVVTLYVVDQEPLIQSVENFDPEKGVELSFQDITIGSTVFASASIRLDGKTYSGYSGRKEVTESGTTLEITLEEVTEVHATPTENGNLITITGAPINSPIIIYTIKGMIGEGWNLQDNIYSETAESSKVTFLDEYVSIGDERRYYILVNYMLYETETVTAIGGKEGLSLSVTPTQEGVQVSIDSVIDEDEISSYTLLRYQIKDGQLISKADMQFNQGSTSLIDNFVAPDTEYTYYVHWYFKNGSNYYPITKAYPVTTIGGYGDFNIKNTPEAEVDYSNQALVFKTFPEFDLSSEVQDKLKDLRTSIAFNYMDPQMTWIKYAVRFGYGADTEHNLAEFLYNQENSGKTFVPALEYNITLDGLYSQGIYRYQITRYGDYDMSGIPDIEIPDYSTLPVYNLIYDDILILKYYYTLDELKEDFEEKELFEETDYVVVDNSLILTDSGFEKILQQFSNGETLVALVIYNDQFYSFFTNEQYNNFVSVVDEEDYVLRHNNKVIVLSDNAYYTWSNYQYNGNPYETDYTEYPLYYQDIDFGYSFTQNELTEMGLDIGTDYTKTEISFVLTDDGLINLMTKTQSKALLIYNKTALGLLSESEFDSLDLDRSYYTITSLSDDKIIMTLTDTGYANFSANVTQINSQILEMTESGTVSVNGYITEQGLSSISSTMKELYNNKSEIEIILDLSGTLGVKYIPEKCFNGCRNLHGVILPDSLEEIEDQAFCGCQLETLTIPDSVTTIGSEAFFNNTNLKTISIGSGLCYIESGAFNSRELEEITLSQFNKEFTLINGILFTKDEKTLVLCPAKISMPDSDYSIPVGVTTIYSYAFVYTSTLSSITIPDTVTLIDECAFQGIHLNSLDIPDSVERIGAMAFESSYLVNISIGKNVSEIGDDSFRYCSRMKSITVDSENNYYQDIDGVLFTKDGTVLIAYPAASDNTSYTIPDSVEIIEQMAFAETNKLTSLIMGENLKTINQYAFYSCYTLSTVSFNSGLQVIYPYAFYLCNSLETVTFANFNIKWYKAYALSKDSENEVNVSNSETNAQLLKDQNGSIIFAETAVE